MCFSLFNPKITVEIIQCLCTIFWWIQYWNKQCVPNVNNPCKHLFNPFKGTGVNLIGNSQRQVFSLSVSKYVHKITNLWKFGLNWSSKLHENDERKTPLLHNFVYFQMHNKRLQLRSFIIWVRNYLFLKNYVNSGRTVCHNALYYQQLSMACYQVSFNANNYFWVYRSCPVPLRHRLPQAVTLYGVEPGFISSLFIHHQRNYIHHPFLFSFFFFFPSRWQSVFNK